MKICDTVINSIWYDPRVKKQLIEYKRAGFELSVIGIEDTRVNEKEIGELGDNIYIVPIEKKYYRENRTIFTKIKRELMAYIKLKKAIIATGADIIHANDLNALVPAYYAAKKLKSKLIYDTHEIFLENNNMYDSRFLRVFWGYFEKKIIKKVDCVVCVSHAAGEYLLKKYKFKRLLVITNCACKTDESVRKTEKSNGFEILSHGRFYSGRGYDTMVKAAPLLDEYPDIKLVLRGSGAMEEQLRNSIKEGGHTNIRIDDPVTVEEIIPAAAKSHVGIAITEPYCLNFKLSVSNKIFEYAAAGLPVIMSDIPEHRYLNDKYDFGIVLSENSPKCLADAILLLYNDRELYNRYAANAVKMSENLNWEKEFAKLLMLERELIKD